jgi:hypothetical protein
MEVLIPNGAICTINMSICTRSNSAAKLNTHKREPKLTRPDVCDVGVELVLFVNMF